MFHALVENQDKLISLKKASVYKGHEKNQISYLNLDVSKSNSASKAFPFEVKEDFIYPVISTTRFRDSHKDVHFDTCFNRTVGRQQGKVMYVTDHKLEFDTVISWPKDTNMVVAQVPWGLVGKDYLGSTEGLIFAIEKGNVVNEKVLSAIEKRVMEFQNSIRMRYEKIILGVDSNEKEMAQQKAYFDLKINSIVNKDEVMEDGYFWGVEELQIDREGSLVIAGGSNSATSIVTLDLVSNPSNKSVDDPSNDPQNRIVKSVWDLYL